MSGVISDGSSSPPKSPWEDQLRKKKKTSLHQPAPSPNPTLVEVHEWVQPSHCHQHDNTLRPGHLLRWMDITACLSGWLVTVTLLRGGHVANSP